MTKARVLADFISDGSPLADGTVDVSEVSGAAPLASPTFTGHLNADQITMSGYLTVNGSGVDINTVVYPNGIAMADSRAISFGTDADFELSGGSTFLDLNLKDTARHLRFMDGLTELHRFSGDGSVVLNYDGLDADFRVESDTQSHMLFVDAANNKVGIATVPSSRLHIKDTNTSTGSTNPPHLRIEGNNGLFYDIGRDNSGTGFLSFYGNQTNANGYIFGGANGERMRINADGTMIHQQGAVFNEGSTSQDFRVESDNNTHALFVDAGADTVHIGTNTGAELVNINQTGRSNKIGLNIVNADSGNGANTMFNLTNNADQDFQIKVSEVGATTKSTYIGPSTNTQLNITGASVGSLNRDLYLDSASLVVNQDSRNYDFRVESDAVSDAFLIDASENRIMLGTETWMYSGNNGTTGKLHFRTRDNGDLSKYIRTNAYWMEYSGNSNEGHVFVDGNAAELMRLRGSTNTTPSRVDIPTANGLYIKDGMPYYNALRGTVTTDSNGYAEVGLSGWSWGILPAFKRGGYLAIAFYNDSNEDQHYAFGYSGSVYFYSRHQIHFQGSNGGSSASIDLNANGSTGGRKIRFMNARASSTFNYVIKALPIADETWTYYGI